MYANARFQTVTGALLLALLCVAALAHADGAPANPHVWQPEVTQVHVYKNGYVFVEEAGAVTLRDGWCFLARTVPAAFGTLWIQADNPALLATEIAYDPDGYALDFDGESDRIAELQTCAGLDVVLTFTRGEKSLTANGRLSSANDTYAIVEGEEGTLAVPIPAISRAQLPGMPVRIRLEGAESQDQDQEVNLTMHYLTRGMRWVPEYTIALLTEDTAALTMRGTLRNDTLDLDEATVSFVVGLPHFTDANTGAPLFNEQPAMLEGSVFDSKSNGIIQIPWYVDNAPMQGAAPPEQRAAPLETPLGGDTEGDYTIYTKEGLSVGPGENTAALLFSTEVAYDHVYRWRVGRHVEHSLRLHNNSGNAWTTGACLVMNGARPISQDTLRYTALGAAVEVPVATAINMAYDATEDEAGRELKAYTISEREGSYLDRVEVGGTLTITNHESHPAEMHVYHEVPGKPLRASDDARTSVANPGAKLTERRGTLSWTIIVPPGEQKSLTYLFERYVPSV